MSRWSPVRNQCLLFQYLDPKLHKPQLASSFITASMCGLRVHIIMEAFSFPKNPATSSDYEVRVQQFDSATSMHADLHKTWEHFIMYACCLLRFQAYELSFIAAARLLVCWLLQSWKQCNLPYQRAQIFTACRNVRLYTLQDDNFDSALNHDQGSELADACITDDIV